MEPINQITDELIAEVLALVFRIKKEDRKGSNHTQMYHKRGQTH